MASRLLKNLCSFHVTRVVFYDTFKPISKRISSVHNAQRQNCQNGIIPNRFQVCKLALLNKWVSDRVERSCCDLFLYSFIVTLTVHRIRLQHCWSIYSLLCCLGIVCQPHFVLSSFLVSGPTTAVGVMSLSRMECS